MFSSEFCVPHPTIGIYKFVQQPSPYSEEPRRMSGHGDYPVLTVRGRPSRSKAAPKENAVDKLLNRPYPLPRSMRAQSEARMSVSGISQSQPSFDRQALTKDLYESTGAGNKQDLFQHGDCASKATQAPHGCEIQSVGDSVARKPCVHRPLPCEQ